MWHRGTIIYCPLPDSRTVRLEKSRAQRILWLLEEVKVDYELKTYKRKNMLAPDELKQIHPLGKSPVISIESEGLSKPMVLAESGFIVEYISDHFGPGLIPKRYAEGNEGKIGGETEEWLRHRYYMHYAEGSIMILLIVALVISSQDHLIRSFRSSSSLLTCADIKNAPVPFFIKPITNGIAGRITSSFLTPNFKTHLDFLESQIATSPNGGSYLCGGDLTGADILMSFPLGAARGRAGLTQEKYPKLWAYLERLETRDAYKRAVQKIIEIEGSYDPSL